MEPVSVNFALTRDDCENGAIARLKMMYPGKTLALLRISGFLLFCAGCAMLAVGVLLRQPLAWIGALFAVAGVFIAFFVRPAQEAAVRHMAGEGFDSGRFGTPAQRISFGPEGVSLRSERYEADIPYGMLYAVYSDENVLLLFTASDEWRIVPKRTMDAAGRRRVESLLAERVKQKFFQEGAR